MRPSYINEKYMFLQDHLVIKSVPISMYKMPIQCGWTSKDEFVGDMIKLGVEIPYIGKKEKY